MDSFEKMLTKVGYSTDLYSSIAQSVERMTVNHDVTGSSPVRGAIVLRDKKTKSFICTSSSVGRATDS